MEATLYFCDHHCFNPCLNCASYIHISILFVTVMKRTTWKREIFGIKRIFNCDIFDRICLLKPVIINHDRLHANHNTVHLKYTVRCGMQFI